MILPLVSPPSVIHPTSHHSDEATLGRNAINQYQLAKRHLHQLLLTLLYLPNPPLTTFTRQQKTPPPSAFGHNGLAGGGVSCGTLHIAVSEDGS